MSAGSFVDSTHLTFLEQGVGQTRTLHSYFATAMIHMRSLLR